MWSGSFRPLMGPAGNPDGESERLIRGLHFCWHSPDTTLIHSASLNQGEASAKGRRHCDPITGSLVVPWKLYPLHRALFDLWPSQGISQLQVASYSSLVRRRSRCVSTVHRSTRPLPCDPSVPEPRTRWGEPGGTLLPRQHGRTGLRAGDNQSAPGGPALARAPRTDARRDPLLARRAWVAGGGLSRHAWPRPGGCSGDSSDTGRTPRREGGAGSSHHPDVV